jgi:hypothetical protein
MVDREEHIEISDLLYAKAKELNLQEDIVSMMLSSECLLVSFDHIIFKKDTHQLGKNISPTRS